MDIKSFEDFLSSISFFNLSHPLIIIDEIGKMELFSGKFKRLVVEILDSKKLVIATIALIGNGLIAEVKRKKDVKMLRC